DRLAPPSPSVPPASDVTLFSLLGLGGLANKNGSQEPTNAALAGRSLLFQSAARLLGSRVLPFVDSFSYDVSGLDTSGDPGPKVSFEKRISDNFRLFLVYNTRDQKRRVVIEWQVNPEWTVEFKRDEMSREYATDARLRQRYEGHWTWGNQGKNAMAFFARFLEPPKRSQSPAARPPVPPPAGAPRVPAISVTADSKFATAVLGQDVSQRVAKPL